MVVDELKERAADRALGPGVDVRRACEVLAVGIAWSLPGMLIGLLAAAISSVWPQQTVWFGVLGSLFGGVVGVWMEAAGDAWDWLTF
jgi:hypothetical protein